MAHVFQVRECNVRVGVLLRTMGAWVPSVPGILAHPLVFEQAGGVAAEAAFEGCIRGVRLLTGGRGLRRAQPQVVVGRLASRTDWMHAFQLLREIVRVHGGVVQEGGRAGGVASDGARLDDRDLSEGQAASRGLAALMQDVEEASRHLHARRRPWIGLTGFHHDLILVREEFLAEGDLRARALDVESRLAARAATLWRAARPDLKHADDGTPWVPWDFSPAILPRVDHVAVPGGQGNEPQMVTWPDLVRAFDGGIESVSVHDDRVHIIGLDAGRTSDRETAARLASRGMPLGAWHAQHASVAG